MSKKFDLMNGLFAVVMAFVTVSCIYSAATGKAIGADYHLNTFGRVMSALGAVFVFGYGLYSLRDLRRITRRMKEAE